MNCILQRQKEHYGGYVEDKIWKKCQKLMIATPLMVNDPFTHRVVAWLRVGFASLRQFVGSDQQRKQG